MKKLKAAVHPGHADTDATGTHSLSGHRETGVDCKRSAIELAELRATDGETDDDEAGEEVEVLLDDADADAAAAAGDAILRPCASIFVPSNLSLMMAWNRHPGLRKSPSNL